MSKIKLLIVDDQEIIREGLQDTFLLENDIQVIELAENGEKAIQYCEKLSPDIVLMDVRMPILDGVEATKIIKSRWPDIRIVILTTFQDINYVTEALRAGAEGYLLKAINPVDLIAGIKLISRGGTFISKEIAHLLIEQMSTQTPKRTVVENPHNYGLTEREMEVLSCLAEGLTNTEISARLFLSVGTVKNYISNIYAKLDLHDRLKVARKAIDEGMV
ncbi:LuxR family two component transcriptional regulator [Ureibacillus xyleni]|uniref:LuxR family two component transcriptional regulator n=1 Tax=Ureibacillus xyleni TaxID=614648 RepID=A0A285SY21_9BACL|nr:response regulator transcription factor [Ureibacillus xyleni]SOC13430.1 LuxR family two component transcriptional regulator [Ureibacillus xyleni]